MTIYTYCAPRHGPCPTPYSSIHMCECVADYTYSYIQMCNILFLLNMLYNILLYSHIWIRWVVTLLQQCVISATGCTSCTLDKNKERTHHVRIRNESVVRTNAEHQVFLKHIQEIRYVLSFKINRLYPLTMLISSAIMIPSCRWTSLPDYRKASLYRPASFTYVLSGGIL